MLRQILNRTRNLFGKEMGTIRGKLVRIVLANSLAAIVILGGISFYGIWDARSTARDMGEEIGRESYQNSSALLIRQRKEELSLVVLSNAEEIDHRLGDVARDVTAVAKEMEEIEHSPERFLPQSVGPPEAATYGTFPFYIQYPEDFSPQEFQAEIAQAANSREILLRIAEHNDMTESVFIASRHRFTLSVDDNRQKAPEDIVIPGLYYDASTKDWYQEAVRQQDVIFTDVRRYVFSNRMGIFCAVPYYGATGEIEGVAGVQAALEQLGHILQEMDLYKRGFCFIVDHRGYVILSTEDEANNNGASGELAIDMKTDLRTSENTELANIIAEMTSGKSGISEASIDGERYYIAYAPVERTGWGFAAVVASSAVIAPIVQNDADIKRITEEKVGALEGRIRSMLLVFAIFVFALFFIVAYHGKRLSEKFAQPIQELSDGVREIASGNMEKKLAIHTGDEIEHLASCFNAMTDDLKAYMKNLTKVTAEKERIATELSVATNIQESMLPRIFPPFPEYKEFDIYATMHAAKEVGGDFYDFYLLDRNHVIITIADVSGKGVPAALFMVITKTILKDFALTMGGADDLAPLVACTNDQLCQNNDAMMFVTAFVGLLEVDSGHFTYVNAGHNPPLVYRAREKRFEYIPVEKNFVLGGMEEFVFHGQEMRLFPGDRLFLYTDGVTEALNEKEELYGESRLLETLNQAEAGRVSLKELLAAVRKSLDAHVGQAEQSDDITMLALAYHGQNEEALGMTTKELVVDAAVGQLEAVNAFLGQLLDGTECSMKARMQLDLAVEEIFVNIASYAYGDKQGQAVIRGTVTDAPEVELVFLDEGMPYNPLAREDPDTSLAVEERGIGGLGIFLAKKNVDAINYEYKDGKNILTIRKHLV